LVPTQKIVDHILKTTSGKLIGNNMVLFQRLAQTFSPGVVLLDEGEPDISSQYLGLTRLRSK